MNNGFLSVRLWKQTKNCKNTSNGKMKIIGTQVFGILATERNRKHAIYRSNYTLSKKCLCCLESFRLSAEKAAWILYVLLLLIYYCLVTALTTKSYTNQKQLVFSDSINIKFQILKKKQSNSTTSNYFLSSILKCIHTACLELANKP